jgi:alkyl hydroperoxide reductase subunit AhpC
MEPPSNMSKYLSPQKISPDVTYQVTKASGLTGTPTLMIVDGGGVVRHALVGALTPGQEEEVLRFVKAGAS